jgi:UDP-N-acetylmuramoyl-tripeptide--D-alanyl-D-alanine ligase
MMFSAEQLALATQGRLVAGGTHGRVCTDTRKIQTGDWFLAIRGERFDAHEFLATAVDAGATGVIAEQVPDGWSAGLITVKNGLEALQNLARFVRSQFNGPVVGITGSAGKTTTRAMIGLALEGLGSVHQTAGNFNNHVGLPLTLLDLPENTDALVLEMGMNHAGEIDLLQEIGRPTVRLITNVGAAHLQGLGSIEAIAAAKGEMFDGARPGDHICVNDDDPRVRALSIPQGTTVLRYGTSADCDLRLLEATVDPDELSTKFTVEQGTNRWTGRLLSPGIHMAHNAVAALSVGVALGLDVPSMLARIETYEPVGMRLRIEVGPGGIRVINDAYNANPMSVAANLKTLAAIPRAANRRRVALLGDMLELGPTEIEQHAETARFAHGLDLDLVGFAGPRFTEALEGAGHCAPDAVELTKQIRDLLLPGDILFIKGSRGMKMERVLNELTPKEIA